MFNKVNIRQAKFNIRAFSSLAQNILLDTKYQMVSIIDNKLRYNMRIFNNFAESFMKRENNCSTLTVFSSPHPQPNYSFLVAFIFGCLAFFTRNKKNQLV